LLEELVLSVVREYKPSRSTLHSIVYLKNGVLLKDWTLTITGVYSERLERVVEELINSGSIRVCNNGRLTTDTCPSDNKDLSSIVDEAIRRFVRESFSSSPVLRLS